MTQLVVTSEVWLIYVTMSLIDYIIITFLDVKVLCYYHFTRPSVVTWISNNGHLGAKVLGM